MEKAELLLTEILELADVNINGSRSWDITVNDSRFFRRVLSDGALGLGESYMDGWWECSSLDGLVHRILKADLEHRISPLKLLPEVIKSKVLNQQSEGRASRNARYHYNLGNILFKNMLDKTLSYSCAYWKNAKSLDEAQEAKLNLICRKIGLKPGMTLLDIGCGFGGLMKYAATNFGAICTGITLSEEQIILGKELCDGLPIKLLLQDYRKLNGKYDRIVSIGMMEHVGPKNYKNFMKIISNCLNENGILLLHTIGANTKENGSADPWMNKYIFPGGVLPTVKQIANAAEGLFVMEDWHNFGVDYSLTAKAWFNNFDMNWENIKSDYYDNRFYRMWKYFLLIEAGAFSSRRNQLWQIVFSKQGVEGGYISIR